ncbi:MAG: GGDEF domain-containing protein [Chromatiaceae bacterium]|nr:GGDEF domain-containing protein [Chromatiaceae bacterium]
MSVPTGPVQSTTHREASVTVPDLRTELYKTIVETSHDAVVVIDHDCRVRLWNRSAESLFGFSEVEMMGCNIHDHITPQRYREMAKRAFTAYQQQRRGGNAIGNVVEIEGLRKDGAEIYISLFLTPFEQMGELWTFAIIRDIEDKHRQVQLAKDVVTDPLTGISNRRRFQQVLEGSFGAAMYVAIVDVDRFKAINDKLGHLAGDDALKLLAERLQQAFGDTLCVARLGGDEFGVVLEGGNRAEVMALFESFRQQIESMENGHGSTGISVSVGIANEQPTPRELLEAADSALYHAKRTGRNRVVMY